MTSRPSRRSTHIALVLALVTSLGAQPAAAEDSAQTRYYLGLRFETVPGITDAHDIAGGSLGANLNKYAGVELSIDSYERKVGEVAELGVLGIVPQVRLRYPLLADRLSPYLLGGVGLSVTQGNDARTAVSWSGGKTGVHVAGTIGGGIEYFIDDNVALDIEGKQLFSGDVVYTAEQQTSRLDSSSAMLTIGMRLFYPQLRPAEAQEAARRAVARFYLHARTGGALLVNTEPFCGVRATPEQGVFGTDLAMNFGVAAGANIGRYAGVELALDNYELKLHLPDVGLISEYSVFPITVQARLRYPLRDGRLQPYVLGGLGGEFAEANDPPPSAQGLMLEAKDITFIGTVAVGLEYFVLSNVSLRCEVKSVLSRYHTFQIRGEDERRGNFDSVLFSAGLSVYLFNL